MARAGDIDSGDPKTWYRPEHAEREVGYGLKVRDLAMRIFEKRKDLKIQPLQSTVCRQFGVNWQTVTWEQMGPAIQDDIFELCYWLRFNPTPQQRAVLQAVQDGELRLAVKSGQGPGKTKVSAVISIFWQFQDIDVRTITTAPSMRQCRSVWLSEVRDTIAKAHPLIRKIVRVTSSVVYYGGFVKGSPRHKNWRCELLTATGSESFQGQHNKRLNAIVEEASGVAGEIIEALKGTVSNFTNEWQQDAAEGAILMIGNPNQRDTEFFKCFAKMSEGWRTITLDAEEAPIVNPKKLIEHAIEFGIDSDFYRVRVLGEFPSSDPTGILNPDDIYACTTTDVAKAVQHPELRGQRQFGIDLARQGGDETVVYRRFGGCIVEWKRWAKTTDFEPAHAIRWAFMNQTQAEWHNWQTLYVFDAGGIGQGVYHMFDEAGRDAFGFHTQHKATKPTFYANRMTEAWFQLRALLRDRRIRIPDDPILHQQLGARHYKFNKDGLLLAEPKDEYMKRTKDPSPDRADALVMAFYQSGYTDSQVARKKKKQAGR